MLQYLINSSNEASNQPQPSAALLGRGTKLFADSPSGRAAWSAPLLYSPQDFFKASPRIRNPAGYREQDRGRLEAWTRFGVPDAQETSLGRIDKGRSWERYRDISASLPHHGDGSKASAGSKADVCRRGKEMELDAKDICRNGRPEGHRIPLHRWDEDPVRGCSGDTGVKVGEHFSVGNTLPAQGVCPKPGKADGVVFCAARETGTTATTGAKETRDSNAENQGSRIHGRWD